MDDVFIVTEANEYVATGHLMECIVCAEELMQVGFSVLFWINYDAPNKLKKRISCRYNEYLQSIEFDNQNLLCEIKKRIPKVVLFNLRKITELFLIKIKRQIPKETKLICIDEFGHRALSADIIINPMIDSYYWNYGKSCAKLFCGGEFLILSTKLEQLHQRNKNIKNEIESVVITMGGVDPKNYTYDLVDIVPYCFPKAGINVVIGGGNPNGKDIRKKVFHNSMINVYENVSDLLEMIFAADLLFCAGGNTLHEASCLGTPAIIFPSMPHEERNAQCFEKLGFGYMIRKQSNIKIEIENACIRLIDFNVRQRMSVIGKSISDGQGYKRVCNILIDILK